MLDFNTLPDGTPYIVLELLQGESLASRLPRGPLPLEQAKSIVTQVGSALAAAHREGVVHRDLKPDNVFLCPTELGGEVRDVVKVLDFGISKIRGSKTVLTQDAALLGTPQYMAPEQATGRNDEIDARTDVFAFGAMTFEMLAGKPPFTGDTLAAVIHAIVYAPTPPLARAGEGDAAGDRRGDRARDGEEPRRALPGRQQLRQGGDVAQPGDRAGDRAGVGAAGDGRRDGADLARAVAHVRVHHVRDRRRGGAGRHDLEGDAARARGGAAAAATAEPVDDGREGRSPLPRRRRRRRRTRPTAANDDRRRADEPAEKADRAEDGADAEGRRRQGARRPRCRPRPRAISTRPRRRSTAGKPADAVRLAQHSLYAQKSSRAYARDRPRALRAGRSRQRQGGAGAGRGRATAPRSCAPVANWASSCVDDAHRDHRDSPLAVARDAAACSRRAPRAPTRPVEPGRVYVGGDGVTIAVVPLKPRTDNKVLVRVTGSGTAFDDKVIPHERGDGDGGKVAYSTTYHGRSWFTITVPSSPEAKPIPIYLPGRRDVTVKYDERRSAELKTDDIFRAYQKQQADGTLKALAAFNRPEETARHEKQLGADAGDAFAKRCGYKLPVKINWASLLGRRHQGALHRQLLRRADRDDGAPVRGLGRGEADDHGGDQDASAARWGRRCSWTSRARR